MLSCLRNICYRCFYSPCYITFCCLNLNPARYLHYSAQLHMHMLSVNITFLELFTSLMVFPFLLHVSHRICVCSLFVYFLSVFPYNIFFLKIPYLFYYTLCVVLCCVTINTTAYIFDLLQTIQLLFISAYCTRWLLETRDLFQSNFSFYTFSPIIFLYFGKNHLIIHKPKRICNRMFWFYALVKCYCVSLANSRNVGGLSPLLLFSYQFSCIINWIDGWTTVDKELSGVGDDEWWIPTLIIAYIVFSSLQNCFLLKY